jgi:hypothetical protein
LALLASTSVSARRTPSTASPAAAPATECEYVNPCVKPAVATVSNTSPLHAASPSGQYPDDVPLPAVMMSGRRSHWSQPNQAPVRPNPVMTSSAISRTPWRSHTSRTAAQ